MRYERCGKCGKANAWAAGWSWNRPETDRKQLQELEESEVREGGSGHNVC